jgi:predicted TIM-barrel fold metal-dependent hydrolase
MIESHGIPVFIEFSAIPTYDKAGYLDVLKRFSTLSKRFPSIRWLLVMAPPIQYFAEGDAWNFPAEVDELFTRDNILLELCYPITWGGRVDYPFPSIQRLIRNLRDRYGASKLVWGSDMPNVERFCTYRQSIDYIRNYCEFLSSAEKDCILGGNILNFLGVPKIE